MFVALSLAFCARWMARSEMSNAVTWSEISADNGQKPLTASYLQGIIRVIAIQQRECLIVCLFRVSLLSSFEI